MGKQRDNCPTLSYGGHFSPGAWDKPFQRFALSLGAVGRRAVGCCVVLCCAVLFLCAVLCFAWRWCAMLCYGAVLCVPWCVALCGPLCHSLFPRVVSSCLLGLASCSVAASAMESTFPRGLGTSNVNDSFLETQTSTSTTKNQPTRPFWQPPCITAPMTSAMKELYQPFHRCQPPLDSGLWESGGGVVVCAGSGLL